jgi:hypothetical protein
MTKTSAKSTSRGKSSKGSKGSVGFVYGGTFRQGLMCVFKSDDKEPTIDDLTKYYGSSLNGRYINVENVDEIYQSFLDAYSDSLIKGTETVFKSSTIKDVSNKLKELGEVTKCHLIKSESSKGEEEEEAGSGEEEEDDKKSKSKSSKSAKETTKETTKETKPSKSTTSKKSKKEETEDEASEDEHSEDEHESEEEEEAPKKSKGKSSKPASSKKKEDSEDEGSDDEGEKLKKKGKSAEKGGKKPSPKKK